MRRVPQLGQGDPPASDGVRGRRELRGSLRLLDRIGSLFGLPPVNRLGQPETALWAIIIVTIWKECGSFMIFCLAALQTIPEDLKEAADIEGASRWTCFRRILLPLLMPTTLFIMVNALINSLKLIDHRRARE